jgi:hypothetical protein
MLVPLVQPTRQTCGQTCVAMLAGVTVEEAIFAVGHQSPTTADDLRRGLEFYGIRSKLPARHGIVWLEAPSLRTGHWIVRYGGCYIDPDDGKVYLRREYERWAINDGRRLTLQLGVE